MTDTEKKEVDVKLTVTGMSCEHCAHTVKKALSSLEGVYEASVDLASNTAAVRYNPDAVTRDDMVSAVENAGYGVAS